MILDQKARESLYLPSIIVSMGDPRERRKPKANSKDAAKEAMKGKGKRGRKLLVTLSNSIRTITREVRQHGTK